MLASKLTSAHHHDPSQIQPAGCHPHVRQMAPFRHFLKISSGFPHCPTWRSHTPERNRYLVSGSTQDKCGLKNNVFGDRNTSHYHIQIIRSRAVSLSAILPQDTGNIRQGPRD